MAKTALYSSMFFFLFTLNQVTAQSSTSIWDEIKEDASHSFDVGIGLLKSPYTASSAGWQKIGIATAGTGMLFLIDPDVKEFALSNQNKTNDWIFAVDKYFNKEYVAVYPPVLYLTGLLFRKTELRRTGLYTMEAVVYSITITEIFKRFFGRSRPFISDDHTTFDLFNGNSGPHKSLPSGHATGAFSFCTVVAKSIDNNWWKTFWYGTAVAVAGARIYHNRHWLSDTVLGGFIGYSTASYVVHFDENQKEKEIAEKGYSVQPLLNSNRIGITIFF